MGGVDQPCLQLPVMVLLTRWRRLPSSLQTDRPAKLPPKQPGMLLGMEKRACITGGSLRGDAWSLLKAHRKGGWVIKVQMMTRFSLKRWCHMVEDLTLCLI